MPMVGTSIVEVDMSKITAGTSQARQRNVKVSDDDDLVSSIKKDGLLSPIIVRRKEDGTFEVVVGQRRFLAHQILKKPTIKACVLEGSVSELDAKKISLIENLARKDMKRADYTDAVQSFMDHYNNTATVAEELGISTTTVRKYLSISRLPTEIREDVSQKKYTVDHATRVLDMLGGDESKVNIEKLRKTAEILRTLSNPVQKKVVEIGKHEPTTPIHKIVEKAKRQTILHHFDIDVTTDQYERISNFQSREGFKDTKSAATELIDMGLKVADE